MQITAIPGPRLLGTGQEGCAIRPLPVNPVAAETQHEIGYLRKTSLFTDVVRRSFVDGENAEHQTLIADGIYVVKLRFVFQDGIGRVLVVCARKKDHIIPRPTCAFHEIPALAVAPHATALVARADGVKPSLTE